MKTVSVPSRLWYENKERILTFPDRWDVSDLTSPGFDKPGLTQEEIRHKVERPIEGPGLEELAKGKKQAVIVFDDMARPTPVRDVAPFVLEALHRAGMRKDQIRFIWALGGHGVFDMINARKKLGDSIVENYPVYNHDAFQSNVWVGRTPTGVEFWLNREFMSCDLKMAIGCITAHVHVGFGGAEKSFFPESRLLNQSISFTTSFIEIEAGPASAISTTTSYWPYWSLAKRTKRRQTPSKEYRE